MNRKLIAPDSDSNPVGVSNKVVGPCRMPRRPRVGTDDEPGTGVLGIVEPGQAGLTILSTLRSDGRQENQLPALRFHSIAEAVRNGVAGPHRRFVERARDRGDHIATGPCRWKCHAGTIRNVSSLEQETSGSTSRLAAVSCL